MRFLWHILSEQARSVEEVEDGMRGNKELEMNGVKGRMKDAV